MFVYISIYFLIFSQESNDFLFVGGSLLEIARNEILGDGSVFKENKSLERQLDHFIVYK